MDPLILISAKIFVAAILIMGGAKKLTDITRFKQVLAGYGFLPTISIAMVAFMVPVIEVLLAVGLFVPQVAGPAAIGTFLLLTAYAAMLAGAFISGRRGFDCGCSWGKEPVEARPIILVRNLALLIAAFLLILPSTGRAIDWFDLLNGGLCAAAMLSLYAAFEAYLSIPGTGAKRI